MKTSSFTKGVVLVVAFIATIFLWRHAQNSGVSLIVRDARDGLAQKQPPIPNPAPNTQNGSTGERPANGQSTSAVVSPKAELFIASEALVREIKMSGNELALTPQEMETLQFAFDQLYARRLRYEFNSAVVVDSSEKRVVIHIPPYEEEGLKLKKQFYDELANKLNPGLSARIENSFGQVVSRLNNDYGAYAQDIVVNSLPDGYYDISRRLLSFGGIVTMTSNSQLQAASLDSFSVFSSLFPTPQKEGDPKADKEQKR